jgi:hypothetical protein
MLFRDVTWGQLRAMQERSALSGEVFSENPLNDPDFADKTKDIPDSEYYFDVSEEEIAQFKAAEDQDRETLFLTTDDENNVLGLIRENDLEGKLYTRRNGAWVPVEPGVAVPELDDMVLNQVFSDEIISDWDSRSSGQPLAAFAAYL